MSDMLCYMRKFFAPTAADLTILGELARVAALVISVTLAVFIGTLQLDIDREGHQDTTMSAAQSMADSKPKNSPSIRTHRAQAEKACGESVIATNAKVFSPDVVVMKMNGKVVIMGLDEALRRSQSKKHADNIWVLGACKSHVTKR